MFSTPDVPDAMPSVREAAIVAAAGQGWSHEVIARTAGVDEPTSGGTAPRHSEVTVSSPTAR